MRILYVEDNPANVFLVKRVARMGNHEIINYIDGVQALRKFDEIDPDLVLMDIQLAGELGGLDVVRQLRERGVKKPIIAVTAYAMVGDKERCIAAGCDDYLAKPLPIPRLVELLEMYSQQAAAKKAAESAVEEKTPSQETLAVPELGQEQEDEDAAVETRVMPRVETSEVNEIKAEGETEIETEEAPEAVIVEAVVETEEAEETPAAKSEVSEEEETKEEQPELQDIDESVSQSTGKPEIKTSS